MVWVGDKERDVVEIAQMMETVRFRLLQQDFFLRRVKPKIEEIQTKTSLNTVGSYFLKPRCPQSFLSTFGGWSESGHVCEWVSAISVFDPAAAKWKDLTITLPFKWAEMDTVVVGTDIFLCGGHTDREERDWATTPTRVLMKFSPNTMDVTRLSMMRVHRDFISLAVHSGYI